MIDRYRACMVLHGTGDAMGYKKGLWEFKTSGLRIYEELVELGGVDALVIKQNDWPVSDDTVLHLAVAECLVKNKNLEPGAELYLDLVKYYKEAMRDMNGRSPGSTCKDSVNRLSFCKPDGYRLPFNPRGAGCGASMRSSCIGLRYPKYLFSLVPQTEPEQLNDLIKFSIESGRMTHHLPIGYLGGFVAALFVAFAIQDKAIENWGVCLLDELPKALDYVVKDGHCVEENKQAWPAFTNEWISYLEMRGIDKPNSKPIFPANYDIAAIDTFYRKLAKNRWPGSFGVDSVIIAYDALLGCNRDWRELILRAAIHGGDSDSTACIAASWFGALYGFEGVSKNNYEKMEYLDRLLKCATDLYQITNG